MIRAINKKGTVSEFTERIWNLMSKNHNGYIEFKEGETPVNIPEQIIEFQVKKKQEVVKVAEVADTKQLEPEVEEPTIEEVMEGALQEPAEIPEIPAPTELSIELMKKYLTDKGIKFHHMLGDNKVKQLYYDNSK